MGDNSKIEWTDATWNCITGCTKVSPGCDHCYAERITDRFHGKGSFADVVLHPERLDLPLRWRKPRRVFVNSMSDLFHDDVPTEFIARMFAVMAATPQHTYQILTKRHARMRSLLADECHCGTGHPPGTHFRSAMEWAATSHSPTYVRGLKSGIGCTGTWPLPNVWLGVSVEDQKWADIRIPALLKTPAAVRFLSCEPLLGPVNLIGQGGNLVGAGVYALPDPPEHDGGDPVCQDHGAENCQRRQPHAGCTFVDWVIAGGESGPGARPMLPGWVRSLRDQCEPAQVPFFFKQWGEWAPTGAVGIGGHDPRRGFVGAPVDDHGCREEIARVGKHAAGRMLDGRTWDEYPAESRAEAA